MSEESPDPWFMFSSEQLTISAWSGEAIPAFNCTGSSVCNAVLEAIHQWHLVDIDMGLSCSINGNQLMMPNGNDDDRDLMTRHHTN